jgi:hypothetical protein
MNILALATRGYLGTIAPVLDAGPIIAHLREEQPNIGGAKQAQLAGPAISGARQQSPGVSGSVSRPAASTPPAIKGSKTDSPSIRKK